MPPIHSYAPYICTPLGVHPHMPHTLLCLCVFLKALHVVGGCNGLPFVLGHPPLYHPCLVGAPLITPPHSVVGSLCIGIFRDISMLCGHFPSVRKGLGMFPPSVGGWRDQHL